MVQSYSLQYFARIRFFLEICACESTCNLNSNCCGLNAIMKIMDY